MKEIKFNLQTSSAIGFIVFMALAVVECITSGTFAIAGMDILVVGLWVYLYKGRINTPREMGKSYMIFERVMLLFLILTNIPLMYMNPYLSFLTLVHIVAFCYFAYELYIIKTEKENKVPTLIKQFKEWLNR